MASERDAAVEAGEASAGRTSTFVLCPGQGAQVVGMGRVWAQASPAAAAVFEEADRILGDSLGASLSTLCFEGPVERLNRTDVSQPAIYVASIASYRGLEAAGAISALAGTAGLSLGEYTALHLAGVFTFEDGLRLVARRGALMQEAAERSHGTMLALAGADETQADEICRRVVADSGAVVLVPANFNAPGQIVLSGDVAACEQAAAVAEELGLRSRPLAVAGAFHSAHMQPAADRMAEALAGVPVQSPIVPVWSNVTAEPHPADDPELLRERLVQQIVSPVRWAQSCLAMPRDGRISYDALAPGSVLRGLMRRIDRGIKVTSHDKPVKPIQPVEPGDGPTRPH